MPGIKEPETLPDDAFLELPPDERGHYVREKVQETLELNPSEGLSASNLAEILPFDKRAIQKHLEVLTHTNVAYTINVGPTKLYYPNERAVHSGFDTVIELNDHKFGVSKIENRLGRFVLIQEKKESDLGGGILVPIDLFEGFVSSLEEFSEVISNGE